MNKEDKRLYFSITGIAFELVLIIFVLLKIAEWLKLKYDLPENTEAFVVIGGFFLWLYRAMLLVKKINKEDSSPPPQ